MKKRFFSAFIAFLVSLIFYAFASDVYTSLQKVYSQTVRGNKDNIQYNLVPVLCFHNLDGKGIYSISQRRFRRYLERIKTAGIRVIPLRKLFEHAKNNQLLNQPSIVITIDDDYENSGRVAAPILRGYRFPASFFVYTRDIQQNPRGGLSWDDLRRLRAEGFDIQNHSFSHSRFHIPRRNESFEKYLKRIHIEINLSRIQLEKNLPDTKIYAFAYPMGFHSEFLKNKLFDSGYELLLTTDSNPVDLSRPFSGTFDRYTIQKNKYVKNPEKIFSRMLAYARTPYIRNERIKNVSNKERLSD